MIEVETPLGRLKWVRGRVTGDAPALAELHTPRPGEFGCVPAAKDYADALSRNDGFLHLVATIWPVHVILANTERVPPFNPWLLH